MIILPSDFASIILAFQPLMLNRTWDHALVMLVGAILAPGKRTVSSVLRIMGRHEEKDFQNYHRVLNRAAWSLRQGSEILLRLLVQRFAPKGPPLLFGIDDTIERRWGAKIRARGIYRDPVRSSRTHLVKASGLRWLSLMLLADIPWARRVWALPVLPVWPLRSATTPPESADPKRSWTGRVNRRFSSGAGCPTTRSHSSPTAPLPPWIGWRNWAAPPSSASLVYVWTLGSTNPLRPVALAAPDGHA